MDTAAQLNVIDNFLTGLGFNLRRNSIGWRTFVPGIFVNGMTIMVDSDRLLSPGDIFHDAGHVATVPSMFRDRLRGNVGKSLVPVMRAYFRTHDLMLDDRGTEDPVCRGLLQCSEAEAIAWSYAAAVASGLPPESVFHPKAYDGEAATVQVMLSLGSHFGVHGLQAAKMTTVRTYPKMMLWLQK
jgi:hypothetical protein